MVEDPGKLWDQILRESQQASTNLPRSPPKRCGLAVLPLRPKPVRIHQPRIARTVAGINPALRDALRALVAGNAPWPLFLGGAVGTGKTCSALCLLDYAGGEYHTVSGLCALLIRSQQGRLEWSNEGRGGIVWPESLWNRLAIANLVVLDEIGCRGQVSDAHYETVKQLVDERHGKPFVAISNLELADLGRVYDDRLASRLAAGTVLHLAGQDQRLIG